MVIKDIKKMNRIQSISRGFRVLFQVMLLIVPFYVVAFWAGWIGIDAKLTLTFLPATNEWLPELYMLTLSDLFTELSIQDRIAGAIVNLIPTSLTMLSLYFLAKLFSLYEKGIIFSLQNVTYFKYIGITMLVKELLQPVYELLVSYVLTRNNPVTGPYFQMNWESLNTTFIIIALIIILISWIMAEGYKMQEEQSFTV